jgi:hypothetical protein
MSLIKESFSQRIAMTINQGACTATGKMVSSCQNHHEESYFQTLETTSFRPTNRPISTQAA